MKARIASGTAAAAMAAALLLSGCGSDDGGTPDDKIKGAQNANDPSEQPSEPGGAGVPEFDLPKDVQVEISEDGTGEPKKDEILRYHGWAMMAQQEAYAAAEPTENFKRFWSGEAAATFEADFAGYREDGLTIAGLDRFYFREVTSLKGDRAIVAACEDQSEAYDKDAETGKVNKTKPSVDSYIDTRATMEKSGDGWKVVDYQGNRGSEECRDKA